MRKLLLLTLGFLAVLLAGCADQAALIKHQADAKVKIAAYRAKADISKWTAVNTLAASGSDVGRATAAMAIQADNIQAGGGSSEASAPYAMAPDALTTAISLSREARGWIGLKFGHDENMSQIESNLTLGMDNNRTSLGTNQIISNTGVAGINATTGLGQSAIEKIPSQ